MKKLINAAMRQIGEYKRVQDNVKRGRMPIGITGLSHIHKANIIHTLCTDNQCGAFAVVSDEAQANRLVNDLQQMGHTAYFYPSRDLIFKDYIGISHEYEYQRLEILNILAQNGDKFNGIVVTCPDSALQHTIPPGVLLGSIKQIKAGDCVDIKSIIEWLIACGYSRCDQVDGAGQFSVRGGIIDFFSSGYDSPFRIEMWGDEVDTISLFDIETQRRIDNVDSAYITPSSEVLFKSPELLADKIEKIINSLKRKSDAKAKAKLMSDATFIRDTGTYPHCPDRYLSLAYDDPSFLFDYMPENALLFLSEPSNVRERCESAHRLLNEEITALLEEGVLCRGLDSFCFDYNDLLAIAQNSNTVLLDSFVRSSYELELKELVSFKAKQLGSWSGSITILKEDLQSSSEKDRATAVLAGTEKAARNLADDLNEAGIRARFGTDFDEPINNCVMVMPGNLSGGFEYPEIGFSLISVGKASNVKTKRRKKADKNTVLHSLDELSVGDYVVHSAHGIGIYSGIHKIDVQGIIKDYIKISYAKGDVLYVPVTQLDMVTKYIGSKEDSAVHIHRLGGQEWQKAKSRVKAAVADMAKELTKLYAERAKLKGYAFSEDNEFQKDFECHFQYEETEDQLQCINDIKSDMQSSVPMDRLLCGDVGYGKTEVALRAAFKCALDSKQCAILVPTTILAWQHYNTILQRLEGFPIRVEMLSRFRTAKEQKEIISKLRTGEIDIIVGTHRIIQKDIEFKDLGLLIIDEEQRFGVAHKEKLKERYPTVDCLTLSATPIPRTLNMAMSGMRDMSVIEQAPMDRRPVQTYVLEYDEGIVAQALRRELNRGGQVYYLHNNVQTIERCANRVAQLVPDARIGVAHGKMTEEQLSEIWRDLIDGEIDILVCTTIIETGVDVPNCNTLIIENADCFGISQLHQLRGRVGRSARMAYAYMTFVKGKVLSEVSTKRLNAIRDFTEFGSGFKIAMRDLEIRGAGNILGAQQHGHMESVGYDMYLKLLSEAVNEENGNTDDIYEDECLVDINIQAHIPEQYISSNKQRIDVYKRIADIKTDEDALDVTDELLDRFGDMPDCVYGLIEVAKLRNSSARLGISEISQNGDRLLFYMKKFDLQMVSKLTSELKGRVFVNATARPHISVKIRFGQSSVDCIREILDVMKKLSNK